MNLSHDLEAHAANVLAIVAAIITLAFVPAAEAGAAEPCPNAAFRTGASASLPDCRAFELVGPPGNADYTVQGLAAQPGGDALYWRVPGGEQVADPADPDGGLGDVFLARRGGAGWNSTWLTPDPAGRPFGEASLGIPGMKADGFLFFSQAGWTTAGWANTEPALYVEDGSSAQEPVSVAPGTAAEPGLDPFQWTVSQDLSSTVFATTAALDPADTDGNTDIYLRRGDSLELISKNTDGTADNSAATPFLPAAASGNVDGTFGDGSLNFSEQSLTGFPTSQGGSPVSADGRSVVFSTTAQLDPADTDNAADLYLWREGQGLRLISDDERSTPGCPTVPASTEDCALDASFVGMSEDASVIYFRTAEGLVDGDTDGGNDIYEYRVDAPAGHRLTLATGPGTSNAVYPVSVTADGQLFFATADRVGVDPPSGTGVVLYRWDGTAIQTVAELNDADIFQGPNLAAFGIASPAPAQRAVRATADGSVLLFRTAAALEPADTDGAADLYLWRAGSGVTRVSGNGSAPVAVGTDGSGPLGASYPGYGGGRVITADASRVFFTSTDALTPDAGPNGRAKLYEWQEGDGIHLVSPPGADAGAISYIDNGVDGANVFFMTADSLVAGDTDGGAIDTYDARVGGGVAEPPPPPAPCTGEGCQGPPASSPGLPMTGSISFVGEGNVPLVPGKASVGVAKAMAVTGTAAKLRVRVPGPGRITVAGSRVRRTGTSVPKAGTYPVKIVLNAAAKKALGKRKKVKVKVRVSYRTDDGRNASKAVTIAFKQPGAKATMTKSTTTRKGH